MGRLEGRKQGRLEGGRLVVHRMLVGMFTPQWER